MWCLYSQKHWIIAVVANDCCFTLTAPEDYTELLMVVPVMSFGDIAIPVNLNDDSIPEFTESFIVNISSTEDVVIIQQNSITVFITDNG